MKKILTILAVSLLFSGCASKNAFDNFSITPTQESSENSIQSSKIKKGNVIDGTMSVIYLNKVYPELYKDGEYFYVYMYTKESTVETRFELNGVNSILVEKLSNLNEFTHLTLSDASWQEYYLVGFKEQGDMLEFVLKNGEFASEALFFEKDE